MVQDASKPLVLDRGSERRDAALRLGAAAAAGSKALSIAAFAGGTALAARHLPAPEFGLWCVLTTFPTLSASLDLGVGNALRNKLAALKSEESAAGRAWFLAAFRLLACIGGGLLLLGAAGGPWLPWQRLLQASSAESLQAWRLACGLAYAAVCLNLPLSLWSSGFFGSQEPQLQSALDAVRSACLLAAVAAASFAGLSLPAMTALYFGAMLACSAAATGFFLVRRGWLKAVPSKETVGGRLRELSVAGGPFAVLQVGAAVIVSTDALIVSQTAGLSAAGDYNAVQRLFLLLITAQFFLLTPLWSAYTQAHAMGERGWVRRRLWSSLQATFALTFGGAAVLALLGPRLVEAWLGRPAAQPALFPAMALWAAVYGLSNCYSVFLNALGILRRQAFLAAAGALVNIPLAFFLGRVWGGAGVCLAGALVILPSAVNGWLETRTASEALA